MEKIFRFSLRMFTKQVIGLACRRTSMKHRSIRFVVRIFRHSHFLSVRRGLGKTCPPAYLSDDVAVPSAIELITTMVAVPPWLA